MNSIGGDFDDPTTIVTWRCTYAIVKPTLIWLLIILKTRSTDDEGQPHYDIKDLGDFLCFYCTGINWDICGTDLNFVQSILSIVPTKIEHCCN